MHNFRLETEMEELRLLLDVLVKMVRIHRKLHKSLKEIHSLVPEYQLVGEAFVEFADSLSVYSSYAIVALSDTELMKIPTSELNSRAVSKLIKSSLDGNVENESSYDEWLWYIYRPIQRLLNYQKVLAKIHGSDTGIRGLNSDNKKLIIAGIRVKCTIEIIFETVDLSRLK